MHTKPLGFQIAQATVETQTPLRIEGLEAFHLQGHYDVKLKFPGKRYRQNNNPFDLYLQQQAEGEVWRLAVPQPIEAGAAQAWKTYLLFDPLGRAS
ncbi:MAG: hypothetical protein HC824_12770 [Synechococcales cyanobacterium RM1_1_8]|nr:hypothetical protein [Synechococcales cyanobacterium RM1_1_8]